MSSENYIIHDQHAVHFLIFTVIDWLDIFTRASYKIEIANALEYCQKNKGVRLFAYCLMTNHLTSESTMYMKIRLKRGLFSGQKITFTTVPLII
jgi:hypothetical protein